MATASGVRKPPVKDMIIESIIELKDHNGSSLVAIKTMMAQKFEVNVTKINHHIKKAIKIYIDAGQLVNVAPGRVGLVGRWKLAKDFKASIIKTKAGKEKAAAKLLAAENKKATGPKATAAAKVKVNAKADAVKKPKPAPKSTAADKKVAKSAPKSTSKKAKPAPKSAENPKKVKPAPKAAETPKKKTPKGKKPGPAAKTTAENENADHAAPEIKKKKAAAKKPEDAKLKPKNREIFSEDETEVAEAPVKKATKKKAAPVSKPSVEESGEENEEEQEGSPSKKRKAAA